MSSFRSLAGNGGSFGGSFGSSFGGSFGGDCLSLTVPLNPHVGGAGAGQGAAGQPGTGAGPAEVRLAGVDTKEKMYEPKQRKKLVRVLTVVAYLFFVSLAAAMLSLYYVFLWNPSHSRGQPPHAKAAGRHLTDDQLRQQEHLALRELQRIQEQRRLRQDEQRNKAPMQEVQQQRLSLQLQQHLRVGSTTLSPDYADFTENAENYENDEPNTEEPPPLPLLRHHGGQAGASMDDADADTAGNAIPQMSHSQPAPRPRAPPSAPSLSLSRAPAGASAPGLASASASRIGLAPSGFGAHTALRHSSLHNMRGLRLD